jgi:hypothetical protein
MPEPLALDLHRRYEAEKLLHSTDVVKSNSGAFGVLLEAPGASLKRPKRRNENCNAFDCFQPPPKQIESFAIFSIPLSGFADG